MSNSNKPAKRTAPPVESDQPTSSKRSLRECMFGTQCYRKNPAHFLEFSHQHLTDILPKWTGEDSSDSLPSDVDPQLKTNFAIILEQLKILKSQGQHRPLPPAQEISQSNQTDLRCKRDDSVPAAYSKKETLEKNVLNEENLSKMMRDKTKHHGDVQAKLDAAAPYYFFLTSITDSRPTHNEPLSITFTELLDPSIGELECSLQINFMVEMGWLLAQYILSGNRFKPLTLLFGVDDNMNEQCKFTRWNITAVHVKPPNAFGHHHTKMSIMAYTDKSIRVLVSTANLVESDWDNRTQGYSFCLCFIILSLLDPSCPKILNRVWVSPRLPQLPMDVDTAAGDSPTMFKSDLLRYLNFYRLPQLQDWIDRVRHADFSDVNVCFVASVPGTHYGPDSHHWGHLRLSALLKSHVVNPTIPQYPWCSWPIIGQFSSIGSLGPEENKWLCSELRASMSTPATPLQTSPFKLVSAFSVQTVSLNEERPVSGIYPSLNNVRQSHDGLLGGACLPYQRKVHNKQLWLEKFLYVWKCDSRFRSRAMPHIKSYARISPGHDLLSWFLLTSANLSKAAWGVETKSSLPGRGLRILSYEAGVLFLPKFIVKDVAFNLESSNPGKVEKHYGSGMRNDYPAFPLHYDLPLQAYKHEDSPWFYDIFSDS